MDMNNSRSVLLIFVLLLHENSVHTQENILMTVKQAVKDRVEKHLKPEGPGIQYVVANNKGALYKYAGGFADLRHRIPIDMNTTMAAFSMTKPLTAIAILQLVEANKIRLVDKAGSYVDHPYDQNITIGQLLSHTSGIPNPLPLKWVHTPEQHKHFDESLALQKVLERNHRQKFHPGEKYVYSNIGYWLLGKIIEQVSNQTYPAYVRQHIFIPLMIKPEELDFMIVHPKNHAHGYLGKYSLMNLVKKILLDDNAWGEYEGSWLRINDVYLDGPAFGGAIGSASAFSRILQDLLGEHSVLLSGTTRDLLFQQAKVNSNENIEMTLSWHIGEQAGIRYFFKEGGGAGFHCEMRIYPVERIASVVMANRTSFDVKKFLSDLDAEFLK